MLRRIVLAVFALAVLFSSSALADVSLKKLSGPAISMAPSGELLYVLTRKELAVFNRKGGDLLSRMEFKEREIPLRVDVWGDKLAVTIFHATRPSSYILKFAGGKFETLLENSPYFLRVLEDGQLVGQGASDTQPFSGDIVRLEERNGKLEQVDALDLPKKGDVYSFFYVGDLVGVRGSEDIIRFFEKRGKKWKQLFKAKLHYRASPNCVAYTKIDVISERVDVPVCVPTPPLVFANSKGTFVIADRHDYLLGGVLFDPPMALRAAVHSIKFEGEEGITQCGPIAEYLGMMPAYYIEDGRMLKMLVSENGEDGGKIRAEDISKLDCSSEM